MACGAEGRQLGVFRFMQAEAHLRRNDFIALDRYLHDAMALLPRDDPQRLECAAWLACSMSERGHHEPLEAMAEELCRGKRFDWFVIDTDHNELVVGALSGAAAASG